MKSLTSNPRIVLYLVKAIRGESGSLNSSNSVMCQCAFLPTWIFDTPHLDLAFLLPKPSASSAGGGSCWRHQVSYDPLNWLACVWLHSHMIPKLPGHLGHFDPDRAGRTGSMAACSHRPDWHRHRHRHRPDWHRHRHRHDISRFLLPISSSTTG